MRHDFSRPANPQTRLLARPLSAPTAQRGVIGIVAALTLASAILFMVLALDSGRLYWEGQELQRLADLAALDAATANPDIFNGLAVSGAGSDPLQAAAEASATRNGAATLNVPLAGVNAEQGFITLNDSVRGFAMLDSGAFNDAVKVSVTKNVCGSVIASLSTLIPGGGYAAPSGDCMTPGFAMTREAVARRSAYVSFSAGTSLLRLDASTAPLLKPLLTDMLGLDVGLDAISYDALADLYALPPIPLRTLLSNLGVDLNQDGELLGASTITLSGLVDELYDGLNDASAPMALDAVQKLANSLGAAFDLQDILQIIPNNGQLSDLLETDINLGDVINAAALASIKNGVDLTGQVGPLTVTLDVVQPPVVVTGPAGCKGGIAPPCVNGWLTEARPAQITLSATLTTPQLLNNSLVQAAITAQIGSTEGVAGINSLERNSNTAPITYDLQVGGVANLISANTSVAISLGAVPPKTSSQTSLGCTVTVTSTLSLNNGNQGSRSTSFGENLIPPELVTWPGSSGRVIAHLNSPSVANILGSLGSLQLGNLPIEFKVTSGTPQKSPALVCNLLSTLSTLLGSVINLAENLVLSPLLTGLGLQSGGLLDLNNALKGELQAVDSILGALGVWLNTIDVEIINVHAGAPQLVI